MRVPDLGEKQSHVSGPLSRAAAWPGSGVTGGGLRPLEQVSDSQLARYSRLIRDRVGVHVSHQKKLLLSNRLRRRLSETGIGSFDAYYRHLSELPAHDDEWNKFFQAVTTHETYLFRDESQWEWFSRVFLKEHAAARRATRRLRVWSAACSTGDEAYTIACCVAAHLVNPTAWQIDILGTDIAAGEIERAREGVFGERAMRLVPREYHRFFDKDEQAEKWTVRPTLRRMVRFQCHNLMHRLAQRPFDLVFLKNVLIYFDKESKRTALDHIAPLVCPGGYLIAGAAEGVAGLTDNFHRVKPWLYQRTSG
ncbi:MAG: protein-glutamate O-methyltransferase CheR [Pirellulaceae bacterium]|nr:protein-glutamate O-methyltransferase CheR [Pirellulaceae bacterium]